ncbi:class I SAM-dependent methyltransferase [Candidatus Daviesbacteria bacterium]|nr:class I SAM-dependent methyltransferase [Candidatus Daviesbacteria bacterium]
MESYLLLIIEKIILTFPRQLNSTFFNLISFFDKDNQVRTLNYGFAGKLKITLSKDEESLRFGLQMYHHVASKVSLNNKKILEVGCGRGGGASYIAKTFKVKSYLGVDFSSSAIKFCQKYYKNQKNLKFSFAEAHNLPRVRGGFDILINVESSQTYHDEVGFFKEVFKILKKGGYFLLVTPRASEKVDPLINDLKDVGFQVKNVEDITPNVIKALDIDSKRKASLIRQYAPSRFLKKSMEIFSAMPGTYHYNNFKKRDFVYLLKILQKPT